MKLILLLIVTFLAIIRITEAVMSYKIDVYWVSINSYDGGWTTWPVDYSTSATLTVGQTDFKSSGEIEIKLLEVSGNQARAEVTIHNCGCDHTFRPSAVVGSGQYGSVTDIQKCRSNECDYVYDHQVQIMVAEAGEDAGVKDSSAGVRDSSAGIKDSPSVASQVENKIVLAALVPAAFGALFA